MRFQEVWFGTLVDERFKMTELLLIDKKNIGLASKIIGEKKKRILQPPWLYKNPLGLVGNRAGWLIFVGFPSRTRTYNLVVNSRPDGG